MFTGIIQAIGRIERIESKTGDAHVVIATPDALDMNKVNIGDSIAVNGACLTVVSKQLHKFAADVSNETLAVTALGKLTIGSRVNLELALTLSTPLGGHLVSGHVDGLGKLIERRLDGRSIQLRFTFPSELARYITTKGSICVDGVSLTVNRVHNDNFELNLIPHTLQQTIMNEYEPGRWVNLEVDLIARYLEKLLVMNKSINTLSTLNETFLIQHGFMVNQ